MRFGDSVTVDCEVNIFDVLQEVSDEELLDELYQRNVYTGDVTAAQAYEALRRGDLSVVERFVLDAAGRVSL